MFFCWLARHAVFYLESHNQTPHSPVHFWEFRQLSHGCKISKKLASWISISQILNFFLDLCLLARKHKSECTVCNSFSRSTRHPFIFFWMWIFSMRRRVVVDYICMPCVLNFPISHSGSGFMCQVLGFYGSYKGEYWPFLYMNAHVFIKFRLW